jgi:predicted NUDIX family NTP pyrophosphohydrolase
MAIRTWSAGVLLYRKSTEGELGYELLLAHPGGPYWAGKRYHAYGVPKGEFDPSVETAECSARREFREETGQDAPAELVKLGVFETKPRKEIHVWVAEQGTFPLAPLSCPPRRCVGKRLGICFMLTTGIADC